MRPSDQLPTFVKLLGSLRRFHARGLLFPLVVVLGAGGLLLRGALHSEPAPTAAPETGVVMVEPPPPSLPTIRPNLEKTPLTYWSDYWHQLGERTRTNLVLIGRAKIPGVLVAPGLALSSVLAADAMVREHRVWEASQSSPPEGDPQPAAETEQVRSGSQRLISVDAEWGLALFELVQPEQGAFSLANAGSARPGSFCAAVTLSPDQRVRLIPGYVTAAEPTDRGESLQLTVVPPYTPAAIVNLDGDLLGIAVRSDGQTKVVSSQVLLGLVARLQANQPCHAIEVAELSPSVRRLVGARSGVVVERVREEAFVPEPSIRPGDVLVEWDGEAVTDVWTFHQLYEAQEAGKLVRFVVVRGRRRVSGGTVKPDRSCRPVSETPRAFPTMGLAVRWVGEELAGSVDGGWQILAVTERSPAERAGLREGDVLIRADRQAVGLQIVPRALERYERRPLPMLLTVRRENRVKLVALEPPVEEQG